ncbi:PA2779 family protein [Candidatus Nitrospira bockiana]
MKTVMKTGLVLYLILWVIVLGAIPDSADAMIAPTTSAGGPDRPADLAQIQIQLESKMVGQRLADLGLSQDEVTKRLSAMTDEQVHQVAQTLDGLQPGGELILILAIIGAVVVVLAIIGLARQA